MKFKIKKGTQTHFYINKLIKMLYKYYGRRKVKYFLKRNWFIDNKKMMMFLN